MWFMSQNKVTLDLFDAASISWKKTTKLNPKADPDAVAEKKKRLKHCWQTTARKSKQVCSRVLLLDECHLMWGDARSYVWGKTDTEIAVRARERTRQTDVLWCGGLSRTKITHSLPTLRETQKIRLITCSLC